MAYMKQNVRIILTGSFLLVIICGCFSFTRPSDTPNTGESSFSPPASSQNKTGQEGYRAVASLGDGFIATGSDGRIDWISESGEITKSEKLTGEKFNCILFVNQKIIVAGEKGTILISGREGGFKKVDSPTDYNINSITLFRDLIVAGTDFGQILIGNEKGAFRKVQLSLKGDIVSLAADNSACYGVTSEGEIISTPNGTDWNILDFNQSYSGFYKPSSFTSVLVTENRVAVAGHHSDGSPVLFFSSAGEVWTERDLNYTDDHGQYTFLEDIPLDMIYHFETDQFILVCSNGKIMTIPSCSHCNTLDQLSTEDLNAISGHGNKIIIVGENFYKKAVTFP